MRASWIITAISTSFAGVILFITIVAPGLSAPQTSSGYALSCALAIVPYVFSRAIQALKTPDLGECTKFIVRAIDRTHPAHDEYENKATRPPV